MYGRRCLLLLTISNSLIRLFFCIKNTLGRNVNFYVKLLKKKKLQTTTKDSTRMKTHKNLEKVLNHKKIVTEIYACDI